MTITSKASDIDDPVLFLKLGILRAKLVENLMKQAVRELHNIVLAEASDFFPVVSTGVFESVADDFFRARTANQFEALVDFIGLAVLDAGIQIFFILADDYDVHTRMFGFDVRVVRNARAHVGV
jgi:hypothetical protein